MMSQLNPFKLASLAAVSTALLVGALLVSGVSTADAAKPNVVIILADDLGYGDVNVNNPASSIPTPHMDRLATEGMRFTDAHSPSAVCTPTRYGVVTGRYCWRTRLRSGVLFGYSGSLIDPERLTIADVFKNSGYRTACVGKWHLGLNYPKNGKRDEEIDWSGKIGNSPQVYGFEHSFLVPASLDMAPYVWVVNDRFSQPATDTFPATGFPEFMRKGPISPDFKPREALDAIVRHAGDWVKKQAAAKEPFFIYIPLTAPHKPVMPAERFQGKSGKGTYGDFILAVDDAVGQVLTAIDEAGVADNTLVVLTSDNGSFMHNLNDPVSPTKPDSEGHGHVGNRKIQGFLAKNHTANGALKGTKADIWEAGHRVPFFVRWPGKTPAGSTSDATICHVDLMATCADIVGLDLPENAAEDSFSLVALFQGKTPAKPRGAVIHHSVNGTFALRQGQWKLIFGSGSGGRGRPRSKPFDGGVQLYDMENDLGERTNLADKHPAIVEELTALLKQYREAGRSRGL